ncbi:MAG: tRNA threonylcarbamoyladenosine dehydratase [Selenomonadaceae bacterium]|nr:tRNA threonylcarbamoyladenosine dehydratase [Selenomonadaceae bacterium]
MAQWYDRTALLLGTEGVDRLRKSRVAVFGVGGVGGFAVEALARAGVGTLDLIDKDEVDITNCNRQIIATTETVGRPKVEAFAERLKTINPDIVVNGRQIYFDADKVDDFDFRVYDFVVDAIDSVYSKLALIEAAAEAGTPIISAMGAGNKLHPEQLELADISETSVCPLARVMRRELKKRGIEHLPVVYSKEKPAVLHWTEEGRPPTGSISFVPSAAGLIIAGAVVRRLAGLDE